MAEVTAYSALNVSATIDKLSVVGLFDGDDAVSVKQNAENTSLVGVQGDFIFSQSADKSAEISVKLQHTSPTHRQLTRKWEQQRQGSLVPFPFDLMDKNSGEGGNADKCFIQKPPDDNKGKNATVREWVLVAGEWNIAKQ